MVDEGGEVKSLWSFVMKTDAPSHANFRELR